MSRAIARGLGGATKKDAGGPERDEGARAARAPAGVDAERLVFVDESSTNIAFTSRYARAPRGGGSWQGPEELGKERDVSSITLSGMGPSMSIEGSSDTELGLT